MLQTTVTRAIERRQTMFEVVAIALVVSVAFVVAGKTVMPEHHAYPRSWRHIRAHDRVYFMRRGRGR